MCMMFSQCNICSMGIYLTIQYQGECGHIEGHAFTPFYLSIMHMKLVSFGPSGFLYTYELNNSLMHPRKHHFILQ